MSFTFVDLFAGIGGFHYALSSLGGQAVLASEIDLDARRIYEHNHGPEMSGPIIGDIVSVTESRVDPVIPMHDVLVAGFPCQPFSKSGYQRGINETRGTLFFNIAKIAEKRKPRVIVLENVRNLIGPNHHDSTWLTIRETLRDLGYRTPDEPTVFSPHLLPESLLGRPQIRERVFIVAVYVGKSNARKGAPLARLMPNTPVTGWDPKNWDLHGSVLQEVNDITDLDAYLLNPEDIEVINIWDSLVGGLRRAGISTIPGHPIWADSLVPTPLIDNGTPNWKQNFLIRNSQLFNDYSKVFKHWKSTNPRLAEFGNARRKLEWQAQDMPSMWDGLMQFRPSGIRVKKATYVPALVAMNQTSIYGPEKRRISLREGARLQGFPDFFSFEKQSKGKSFKQLGNAVNVGVVSKVLTQAALTWDFFPEDIRSEIINCLRGSGAEVAPLDFHLRGS
jgi:DNA (cytosine-5)-methyltransferase 1